MSGISTFPDIPKLPYPEAFAPKIKRSKIDWAFSKLGQSADSEHLKSAHLIGETTSTVFSNIDTVVPEDVNIIGTVCDAIGILRGLEAVAIIVQNSRKKGVKGIEKTILRLEIAQSAVDIIGGAGSVLGIVDKISTIGPILSAASPVPVVFSLFSIISSEFTIVISAIKIKQLVKKVKRATQKIKVKWNQPIDATFSKKQVSRIAEKQEMCVQNALKVKVDLENKEKRLTQKKEKFEKKSSKLFQKIAKRAYKKEIKKYQKTHNQLQTLEKIHKLQTEKILKWQAIGTRCEAGTLTDSEKEALDVMQAAKIKKWKIKKVNEYWNISQEVLKIALAVIAIAVSIASIGVVIAFSGNVPAAALVAMGVIGLSMAAMHLARALFFSRIKKEVNPVEVPDFRDP